MYTITCDGEPILDLRDDAYILTNPKVAVECNKIGEASFTIYSNHPNYGILKKLKSVIEVSDEFGVIFRGRITSDTRDFYNGKYVDVEGAMAYFNDSIIRPYNFPEDFMENTDYIAASESGNVIQFFLNWIIEQHNSQVQDFQKFKLGDVTVSDPNNYITRSSTSYQNVWETLKTKLFDSSLGGFLCIRYEADGNYIDYLSEFTLTNNQTVDISKNLLDIIREQEASTTYSAIIPIGAEINVETDEETDESEKVRLTISGLADGDITEDLVKSGDTIYSKSAVESYGWIYAPVEDTTWDDVTEADNLRKKGADWLASQGIMLADTITITAADLHFSDAEIRSFRIYRKVNVTSAPHAVNGDYDLAKLEIDILNPQNTQIVVGETKLSLTDQNNNEKYENVNKIEKVEKDIEESRSETKEVKNRVLIQETTIVNTCKEIIMGALESYVETGDYEEFKRTVSSQLSILADKIEMEFSETVTQIENVNGDLQETTTKFSKYFDFSVDGIIIKSGEGEMKLHLDNDIVRFLKNGIQFGKWDGIDFYTGNIVIDIEERAQFGNFALVPRSDGSLVMLQVDDYVSIVITTQPTSMTVKAGTAAKFTVKATGADISYQWQRSIAGIQNGEWVDGTANSAKKETWGIATSSSSAIYQRIRCKITDRKGKVLYTNTVGLTVNK